MKIGTIQSLACVGLGAVLGFVAATRGMTPSSRADAAPRPVRQVAAETSVTDAGRQPALLLSGGTGQERVAGPGRCKERQRPRAESTASGKKPNIVVIMGDDVGWFNIGAYHRGMMAGRTPNLDRLAAQGMLFTDYYAEASCTAGRANFITGQLPIRTGMTTVGQAGATIGLPAQAPTIATALKSMGYATGQFGKNHLGDRNEFLPTVHGFDEFFGYLYHLDAMEDPAHPNYPPELKDKVGPRNMVHSWATDQDDPTEQPRWGKIGKQKIEDAGTLYPKRMETVDDEILEHSLKFIDKAKSDGKPFFLWLNPTRMHVVTHLSEKYEKLRTPENGWSIHEAGMAQLDDIVGSVMKKLEDMGARGRHHRRVHDRQRHRELHLARRRPDAVRGRQGDGHGGRLPRSRASCAGRARFRPARSRTGSSPGSTGSRPSSPPPAIPSIVEELKQGKTLGDTTYKVHLDGYNQMDLITGKGPSKRHEIWYFAEGTLGAARIDDFKYRFIDQPNGWFGGTVKPDMPILVNLRLDPFERTGFTGSIEYFQWFKYEFWRFVYVQQEVAKLAQTAIEFPPMQKGASFNLEAVKEQIQKAAQIHAGK